MRQKLLSPYTTLRVEAVLRLYLPTVLVYTWGPKNEKNGLSGRDNFGSFILLAVIISAFCGKGRILTIIFHFFVCF